MGLKIQLFEFGAYRLDFCLWGQMKSEVYKENVFDSIPDCPARSHSLYLLSYPAHILNYIIIIYYMNYINYIFIKIFRRIYGPKYENEEWKSRTNRELEEMSKGENIVK